MQAALIGASGFVGGNLPHDLFKDLFRSTNIEDIKGKTYDLVVCAGAPAAKWKANQDPEGDLANLQRLTACLAEVNTKQFLLISTVDVYHTPVAVDEDTPIEPAKTQPYGKHRYFLETFVRDKFPHSSIVRLPGLFGRGLKKNIIFDLIHRNALHLSHADSYFQFYCLDHLWRDLAIPLRARMPLVNFATEPVQVRQMARECFGEDFDNVTNTPPARYDMRTKFAERFGAEGPYLYTAKQTFDEIRLFAARTKSKATA
ncbi:MAG: NAD(P)-dependent oxidoreductase [Bryobacterales bacterium]|nr:NAD(P)-dependent oxidoreductase [Bryobacterales bacterium]MBV9396838.1 NAD(P)-dependent oxidoreductase [Bryobacterales bacterium]